MSSAVRHALPLTLMLGAGLLGGCYGYASYPPVETASPVSRNPNAPPIDELMMLATRWVADRYPPPRSGPAVVGEAQFAINLPEGVRRDVYERVSERTGGRAVPLTQENAQTLPVYHISRIWVRMHDAKVDIMRPRLELPRKTDGQPVYECITLLVEGGLQPWRVTRFQTWEVGIMEPPPLWYCPADYGPIYAGSADRRSYPASPAAAPEGEVVSQPDRGVDQSGAPLARPVSEAPTPQENPGD